MPVTPARTSLFAKPVLTEPITNGTDNSSIPSIVKISPIDWSVPSQALERAPGLHYLEMPEKTLR